MEQEEKPSYNLYDNIHELKQEYRRKLGRELDLELDYKLRVGREHCREPPKWLVPGSIEEAKSPEHLIYLIASSKVLRLPIWKVVCPSLDDASTGSIYYIIDVAEPQPRKVVYRATYGYRGTGPHEAMWIELFLEAAGLNYIEVRSGDYLLDLLLTRPR